MALYGIAGLLAQGAVMVFFVLSGFLIGKSLTRNIQRNNTLNMHLYLKDRFNRIYPPFLFSIFLIGVLYLLAPFFFESSSLDFLSTDHLARQSFEITLPSVISSLFFLNGFVGDTISVNGPLWSLSYEVWYYILAAFLLKSSKPIYAVAFIILLIILSILNKDFLVHSTIWFLGLLLCIFHNNKLFSKKLNSLLYLVGISGTLIFSYIFLSTQYTLPKINLNLVNNFSLMLYKLSLGLLTACVVYSILRGTIKFPVFLKSASAYSYTLYIIHFPILLFIFGVFQLKMQGNMFLLLVIYICSCIFIVLMSKVAAKKVENMKLFK